MNDPVSAAAAAAPLARLSPSNRSTRGFRALLRESARVTGEPSGLREALRDAARSLERGQRLADHAIAAARRGHSFSHEQLIAVQAGVYRYAQELELASKLVDKATGAIRQTLQSGQ